MGIWGGMIKHSLLVLLKCFSSKFDTLILSPFFTVLKRFNRSISESMQQMRCTGEVEEVEEDVEARRSKE